VTWQENIKKRSEDIDRNLRRFVVKLQIFI